MNEPIYFTDDDTPLFLEMAFNEYFGGEAKLTLDFKPMLRAVWRELLEVPDYTEAEKKEFAKNVEMDEEDFREKWATHRAVFQKKALRKTMDLLKETIPDTLTDVLKALLSSCRFKAVTETNREATPVVNIEIRLSKITELEWDNVPKKLNKRLGIHPGNSLDLIKFWEDMEGAWQRMNKPIGYLSPLTQEEFVEALGISITALRKRIKGNLQTNWTGFKQALRQRLTAT